MTQSHPQLPQAVAQQFEGLTHYAITVRSFGADEGLAEFRVMAPPTHGMTTGRFPAPKLSDMAVSHYWTAVQDCIAAGIGAFLAAVRACAPAFALPWVWCS